MNIEKSKLLGCEYLDLVVADLDTQLTLIEGCKEIPDIEIDRLAEELMQVIDRRLGGRRK